MRFNSKGVCVRAVTGVSFTVDEGETIGIVGESGCGKTTLGRCIVRAYEPSEGEVLYTAGDGETVNFTKIDPKTMKKYRKEIQMIFQDPYSSLDPRMTVYDIIKEPLLANFPKMPKAEMDQRIMDIAAKVGLNTSYLMRYPHAFSGGQRQRIGIARALTLNPSLIILDEPVSALDVSVQSQVLNLLLELQEERKLSYLFIAHDLAVVKHISDRVAVMYLGKIVEMSDAETIYQSPKHAYTKALLDAIPEPDPSRANKHQPLPGDVPSPINPPLGSAFGHRIQHPSYPETVGADLTPVEIEPGHWVAPDPCALEPEDWNRIRQR